ncbi:PREDICTED: dehydrodolichyl diphosphate synthase complex subunit nus1-like [Tarenaya hassleriana]|uniref:dehydrodolichyl diphosphate synthase complex subunit nus1-like n=1 Tax=Tarenaya hassleriana TaxID=28532 RepID=UPI00053C2D73|nr:PREDICTED: dehydrodolichyl diphosphate synthase complex subunit nus1-like [Tarenaya hassleriana]XP_010546792.1 PREDICTED: dehydrodolichyl diphosphate synthase complex subunit nus1-like [Tarenaya hassleriana]XP_010546802.1 PREDICTED: dehydrodolichyl diphosphate synthase complex subunit nus1-like [Tarenaya hassleriana]
MDWNDGIELLSSWTGHIGNLGLHLLWRFIHIVLSLWFIVSGTVETLECYLISSGLIQKYRSIHTEKLRYLAIVVESEETREISKVLELLRWLTAIGVRRVCLFDSQGLLKKSKDLILGTISGSTLLEEVSEKDSLPNRKGITLEFISSSDNKDAVAKAANILLQRCLKSIDSGENVFTETHLREALKAVGDSGQEPDLMLVYGPVRCHLGFPAWKLQYTEIVHMGPLKSMKYGSLVKEIHKFTRVRQNYGA